MTRVVIGGLHILLFKRKVALYLPHQLFSLANPTSGYSHVQIMSETSPPTAPLSGRLSGSLTAVIGQSCAVSRGTMLAKKIEKRDFFIDRLSDLAKWRVKWPGGHFRWGVA